MFAGGFVSTPSISSVDPALDQGNRAVIDLLAAWLEDSGCAVEIMPLAGEPAKANLIATLGSGPGGLVLSGHTDTVPFDEGRWQYDPFALTEANQRLYGLGTADMKAFLALAIEALRNVRAADLKEPLILLATADEETTMSAVEVWYSPQDPTKKMLDSWHVEVFGPDGKWTKVPAADYPFHPVKPCRATFRKPVTAKRFRFVAKAAPDSKIRILEIRWIEAE